MKKFNIDELINECRKYTPLDGRVLVHTLKIRKVRQDDHSFDLADTKANEGKNPAIHRVDLKKVRPMINAKYQEAIVLQVPMDENRFKPGDRVVYPIGCVNPFDLIKGVSLLRKYDIAAVITQYDTGESGGYEQGGKIVNVPIEERVQWLKDNSYVTEDYTKG
jgi:hypothetical protein